MNIRIQRLFRAHKSLAVLSKRCISTEVPPAQPRAGPEGNPRGKIPKRLSDDALKINNALGQHEKHQVTSSLHPSLQEGYEVGGRIKQGKLLNVHDEDDMPTWGEWGIPVNFVSRSRPHTTLLWVLS